MAGDMLCAVTGPQRDIEDADRSMGYVNPGHQRLSGPAVSLVPQLPRIQSHHQITRRARSFSLPHHVDGED